MDRWERRRSSGQLRTKLSQVRKATTGVFGVRPLFHVRRVRHAGQPACHAVLDDYPACVRPCKMLSTRHGRDKYPYLARQSKLDTQITSILLSDFSSSGWHAVLFRARWTIADRVDIAHRNHQIVAIGDEMPVSRSAKEVARSVGRC